MNILILTNTAYFDNNFGYAVVGKYLSRGLRDMRHNVFYMGMQSIHTPFKEDGITYLGVRFDPFGGDVLADFLRIYDIDVLITMLDIFYPPAHYINELIGSIRKSINQKKVCWICHITINSSPLSPELARRVINADIIVAPSDFNYRMLCEGNLGHKSRLIHHGCDLSVFGELPPAKISAIKEKLGISDKKFIALCVGRNKGQQKNYSQLFRAWKFFLEQNPKARDDSVLLILADPLENEGIRLDVMRYLVGLHDTVKFIVAQATDNGITYAQEGALNSMPHHAHINFSAQEMNEIYNACDVFVTGSCGESFGLPVIESFACGKPAIGVDFSAVQDHIKNSGGGRLASVKMMVGTVLMSDIALMDEQEFADHISFMYKYPSQRKEMGVKGRKFAQEYSWDKIMAKWKNLMDEIETEKKLLNYSIGQLGV